MPLMPGLKRLLLRPRPVRMAGGTPTQLHPEKCLPLSVFPTKALFCWGSAWPALDKHVPRTTDSSFVVWIPDMSTEGHLTHKITPETAMRPAPPHPPLTHAPDLSQQPDLSSVIRCLCPSIVPATRVWSQALAVVHGPQTSAQVSRLHLIQSGLPPCTPVVNAGSVSSGHPRLAVHLCPHFVPIPSRKCGHRAWPWPTHPQDATDTRKQAYSEGAGLSLGHHNLKACLKQQFSEWDLWGS